jgi:hypothetical protein
MAAYRNLKSRGTFTRARGDVRQRRIHLWEPTRWGLSIRPADTSAKEAGQSVHGTEGRRAGFRERRPCSRNGTSRSHVNRQEQTNDPCR